MDKINGVTIPTEVDKFRDEASEMIASYEHDLFSMDTFSDLIDMKIESVIEQYFYIATKLLCKINRLTNEQRYSVEINPQVKIDKYRVDFRISKIHWEKAETIRECIIECDGHAFHDRDEKQRRYEKQRDRYLQSQGYRVFHFTGSEVKQNAYKCAAECLSFVTGIPIEEIMDVNYLKQGYLG
jgi:very-short-patch-repair endonuclease